MSHERAITLVFRHQQRLADDAPFRLKCGFKMTDHCEKLRQISVYNISPVRDNEKSSIMTNRRKSTKGFPASYRLSPPMCVTKDPITPQYCVATLVKC